MTGAGAARTRLQAAAARGLTRFVGRDAEVEQLRSASAKAGQGHGEVVAVVGEPGIGKSRLFFEFTRSLSAGRWLVLESGSVSYGKATAYLPVIDLLKVYFQIEARDDARRVREKVSGKLVTLEEALLHTLPAFMALLDFAVEDAQWQGLDPSQRRQRTLDAVRRLLIRESQVQPLLLVFEDLHWIDSETQVVLDSLVESLPTTRILLLVNYRPEYGHSWGSKTYYRQLQITPLPPESAEELLVSLLGDDASLGALKRILFQRTEGNPFFLEESVRTLIETKVLTGERGAHRLVMPVEQIQVLATVQAVLAARIDRLPPEEKSLLQMAAVIGKDVPGAVLRIIGDLPEPDFQRDLAHLQAAEFLYETSLFPEAEYTFKHALTHEVAYAGLLHERRRALHARIVEAIEGLYRDRLVEQVERLGHHAFQGELWNRAASYLRQAGAKAAWRSVHREAAACLAQARTALGHLPESRDRLAEAVDILLTLRQSLNALGETERTNACLSEAEALAQSLGDDERLGQVLAYMAESHRISGAPARALEVGERALALATRQGSLQLKVVASFYLGWAHHDCGAYRSAVKVLDQAARWLNESDLTYDLLGQQSPPSVSARWFLALSLAELGQFDVALRRGEEALHIAETVDRPWARVQALNGLGVAYLRKGDLDRAISTLERAVDVALAAGIPVHRWGAAIHLGAAYERVGRSQKAAALLEEATEHGTARIRLQILVYLSEVRLREHRVPEAADLAARALALACEREQRGVEAWSLRLLGEIASHRDAPDPGEAEGHYRAATALADELGMRPLVAHCHLGLAELARRVDRREQAQHHLTTATTMYREMDMRFWLEKAEAGVLVLGR